MIGPEMIGPDRQDGSMIHFCGTAQGVSLWEQFRECDYRASGACSAGLGGFLFVPLLSDS